MHLQRKHIDGKRFGTFIYERRKFLDIPRTRLARAFGVSWIRMTQIELGEIKRLPGPEQLNALSELLLVPVEKLLRVAGYDLTDEQAHP